MCETCPQNYLCKSLGGLISFYVKLLLCKQSCSFRLMVCNLKVLLIVKRMRYVLLLIFFPIPDVRRFCLTGVDGKDIYGK